MNYQVCWVLWYKVYFHTSKNKTLVGVTTLLYSLSRNVAQVTPKIIYFYYQKMLFTGSKYPKNNLFNFEKKNHWCRPPGETHLHYKTEMEPGESKAAWALKLLLAASALFYLPPPFFVSAQKPSDSSKTIICQAPGSSVVSLAVFSEDGVSGLRICCSRSQVRRVCHLRNNKLPQLRDKVANIILVIIHINIHVNVLFTQDQEAHVTLPCHAHIHGNSTFLLMSISYLELN